jgi:hypothetical protein
MRLSTRELQALRSIIGELDPAGCLYLYGSRADDARRGGDIDDITIDLQRKGFVAP